MSEAVLKEYRYRTGLTVLSYPSHVVVKNNGDQITFKNKRKGWKYAHRLNLKLLNGNGKGNGKEEVKKPTWSSKSAQEIYEEMWKEENDRPAFKPLSDEELKAVYEDSYQIYREERVKLEIEDSKRR